ncbi:MAG TPA: hypothetical protein VNT55_18765 [Baekduia sp.]|nr:hypothetical protein [Baekduia sp.]
MPPPLCDLWRRGQEGWPRRFVLVQFPNTPLLVALAGGVVARFTDGTVRDVVGVVAGVALAVWALEELLQGVNWFRRALGAAFLVLFAVRLLS